jgi:parvulin-like peptidyl-prolyl isomerase
MRKNLLVSLSLLLVLSACNLNQTPPSPTITATLAATVTPVAETLVVPTATKELVYVAFVNGEGITESQFQTSLMQLQQVLSEGDSLEDGQDPAAMVIEDLISRQLLSQAARANGYTAEPEMVQERFVQLIEKMGSTEALGSWMAQTGYTQDSFLEALKLEMEAAWQRQLIFDGVPTSIEQVRVQQVLFNDAYLAERAFSQLEAGASFEIIVTNNDPNKYGYLGWVPRGYFLIPGIEEVVFSLQPGEYSEVVETVAGFHIFYVHEYQAERPLSADALIVLQAATLKDWVAQQRAQSQIEILLP